MKFLLILSIIELLFRINNPAICLVVVFLAVAAFSSFNHKYIPHLFYGFLIPLAPAFGHLTLLALTCIYLSFQKTINTQSLKAAAPFLLLCLMWLFTECIFTFEYRFYTTIFKTLGDGILTKIGGFADILRHAPAHYFLTFEQILRMTSALILFDYLRTNDESKLYLIRGLIFGVCISVLILIIQLAYPSLDIFVNFNQFWRSQNRFPASFSDPNAFGLFAVLVAPIFIIHSILQKGYRHSQFNSKSMFFLILLSIIFVTASFYSGSRSMIIGILLQLVFFLILFRDKIIIHKLNAVKISKFKITCLFFVAIFFLPVLFSLISDSSVINRLSSTLSPATFSESIFSRSIFWRLCLWMWEDNPLIGVGYQNFRSYVTPYLISRNVDINQWVDNPNNFYLGILAEMGLAGIAAFILAITRFKFVNKGPDIAFKFALITLISFSILLILGPHIEFDEISVLSVLLLTYCIEPKESKYFSYKVPFYVTFATVALILFRTGYGSEKGLYGWEKDAFGVLRWTGPSAKIVQPCIDNMATVRFKSVVTQQNIVFQSAFETKTVKIADNSINKVYFECYGKSTNLKIEVGKPWIPFYNRVGEDRRVLGIQIYR